MEIKISQTSDLISVRQNNHELEYGKYTHVQIHIHTFTLRFWYFIYKVHGFSVEKPINYFSFRFFRTNYNGYFPNSNVNNWISHLNCAF